MTCDGLVSRIGEVEILPAASCYRNRKKLQQLWARLGSKALLILFHGGDSYGSTVFPPRFTTRVDNEAFYY